MIDIDAEFEKFFEFPTADRSTVSSVSCKLFARHVADMARKASQTKNDEARQSAFDAGLNAEGDLRHKQQIEIHRLLSENEVLRAKLEPDQFWLYDDPENSFASTLENLVQEHADNCVNDPKDFVGYEFKVMRSVRLPNITVKITGYRIDEDGDWSGWEWESK